MHKLRTHLPLVSLFLLTSLSNIFARTSFVSGTLDRVPADSILVLSVDGKK